MKFPCPKTAHTVVFLTLGGLLLTCLAGCSGETNTTAPGDAAGNRKIKAEAVQKSDKTSNAKKSKKAAKPGDDI